MRLLGFAVLSLLAAAPPALADREPPEAVKRKVAALPNCPDRSILDRELADDEGTKVAVWTRYCIDENGRRDGTATSFYANGHDRGTTPYFHGDRTGLVRTFSSDGKRQEGYIYKFNRRNGPSAVLELGEDGKTWRKREVAHWSDDHMNGARTFFLRDGSRRTGGMKDDKLDGQWTAFYPSGCVREQGDMREGRYVGEWNHYADKCEPQSEADGKSARKPLAIYECGTFGQNELAHCAPSPKDPNAPRSDVELDAFDPKRVTDQAQAEQAPGGHQLAPGSQGGGAVPLGGP